MNSCLIPGSKTKRTLNRFLVWILNLLLIYACWINLREAIIIYLNKIAHKKISLKVRISSVIMFHFNKK